MARASSDPKKMKNGRKDISPIFTIGPQAPQSRAEQIRTGLQSQGTAAMRNGFSGIKPPFKALLFLVVHTL